MLAGHQAEEELALPLPLKRRGRPQPPRLRQGLACWELRSWWHPLVCRHKQGATGVRAPSRSPPVENTLAQLRAPLKAWPEKIALPPDRHFFGFLSCLTSRPVCLDGRLAGGICAMKSTRAPLPFHFDTFPLPPQAPRQKKHELLRFCVSAALRAVKAVVRVK